jgi:multiple antibiotic resistance protein
MSHKSNVHSDKNLNDTSDVAISPLAIPILAGPGTIVTAMNSVTSTYTIHVLIVIAIFALMIILTYFCFILSERIVKFFGKNMISVIGKIMGLILAIIGVQMVIDGVNLLLPA